MTEPTTTIAVYRSDHELLKTRQRELNFGNKDWNLSLADVVHGLIEAVQQAGEGA